MMGLNAPRYIHDLEQLQHFAGSARSLSECLATRRAAKPKPELAPFTCAACLNNRHSACVSRRCECGKKHEE
jgi:hypothetical protein